MKWEKPDDIMENELHARDMDYEIRIGKYACTLYCDGYNIGSYTTVKGAKRAADRFEIRRSITGKSFRYPRS